MGGKEGWGWCKPLSQAPPLFSQPVLAFWSMGILVVQGLPQIRSQTQETCHHPPLLP